MRVKKSFTSTRRRQLQRHHTKMLNRRHLQFSQSILLEGKNTEA